MLLGQPEELGGRQQTVLGVLPPHERFEPADRSVNGSNDGLVEQPKLAVVDGGTQLGLGHQRPRVPSGVYGCRHVVADELVTAGCLRPIHGRVGLAQNLVGRHGLAVDHESDRGADGNLDVTEVHRVPKHVGEPFGGLLSDLIVRQSFADDDELVAAESGDRIARSAGPAQALRHLDEEHVTGLVAEGVIDFLELVQVDEEHSDQLPRAPLPLDGPIETSDQVGPVRQTGEAVEQRLAMEFGSRPALLTDVLGLEQHVTHAVFGGEHADGLAHPDRRSVPGAVPAFALSTVLASPEDAVELLAGLGPIFTIEQVQDVPALELVGDVAELAGEPRIRGEDQPVRIELPQRRSERGRSSP